MMWARHSTRSGLAAVTGRCGLSWIPKGRPPWAHTRWLVSSERDRDPKTTKAPPPSSTTATTTLPGLLLAASTAVGGFGVAGMVSDSLGVALSGIPVSILLGMGLRHLALGESTSWAAPGLQIATKPILQLGIVCVAAKLSVYELWYTGSTCLPVVLASLAVGSLVVPLAGRVCGLSPKLSYLMTVGTTICGVTAISALAPAIQASPRDMTVAIANTVVFGTMGMLCYPYLLHSLDGLSSAQIGMCLGVGIHDTSQVLGAAMSYRDTYGDDAALAMAAVTKLVRNVGLVVAIPFWTMVAHRTSSAVDTATTTKSGSLSQYIPSFLVAFVAMTAVRSCGDAVLSDVESYKAIVTFIGNDLSKYCLGTAMAGVGLSTNLSSLRGVGWKPFAVGFSGALVVGGTGLATAVLIA